MNMRRIAPLVGCWLAVGLAAAAARAETPISYAQAVARARQAAPDLAVARGREAVAGAEVGVAGVYPNPSLIVGTSTQSARFSIAASVPLILFGQRGAAMDASRAELATVRVDSEVTWNEVRSATAHAFVSLWLAQRTAAARADAMAIARRLEDAVIGRVELGAAPPLEALRVRAERLRADADAQEAVELVDAAANELGRWLGATNGSSLRAEGDPDVPNDAPAMAFLAARVGANPAVRREESDARAAEARADRERALVRPALTLDLGADIGDPTLSTTNYRAQLAFEVPLFSRRGPQIERERTAAAAARTRSSAERTRLLAALETSYRTFRAASARRKALEEGVVPAAEAAAVATEESYKLGRAQLIALLDAEKTRLDARLTLLDARAARANAWIDLERAMGHQ